MEKFILRYDKEKGETFFKQYPSEIHSRRFIAKLQRKFHSVIGNTAEDIIYSAAKESAIETVERYELLFIAFSMMSKRTFADNLMEQLPRRGFGVGTIEDWNEKTNISKLE